MKRSSKSVDYTIYCFCLFVLLFTFSPESMAQNTTRQARPRPSTTETESVSNLTDRAKIKNEMESRKPSHIVWERLIYRIVDLTKESNNAALYYPVQPQSGRQNLFTLVFKLLADNKITAYRHLDTGEMFSENQKINFEESLKSPMQVLYSKQGERFVVDDRDIPGMEVTQYMVKEGYYFDQATGTFQTRVLALCPILVREDFYMGGVGREPLFWLKYDDIRPYLSREMMMTSDYNNALTYTIDDYFRKTMYTGEIFKTINMMDKTLAEQVGDENPDALKQAQDSIEAQLTVFQKNLWIYNDSIHTASVKAQEKKVEEKSKTTSGRSSTSSSSQKSAKEKTQKEPKSQPASKSDAAPVRSVRR
jgi:gliding motility associated protien GldN